MNQKSEKSQQSKSWISNPSSKSLLKKSFPKTTEKKSVLPGGVLLAQSCRQATVT